MRVEVQEYDPRRPVAFVAVREHLARALDGVDSYVAEKSPLLQGILRRAGLSGEERDAVGRMNPT